MDYTALLSEKQESQAVSQRKMQALSEVCQQIVDARKARGKQYDLAGLLVVLVLANLAGTTSLLGASEWAQDQEERLREGLGRAWKRMPCANT